MDYQEPQRLNYREEAHQWLKTNDAARALGLSTQTIQSIGMTMVDS